MYLLGPLDLFIRPAACKGVKDGDTIVDVSVAETITAIIIPEIDFSIIKDFIVLNV